MSRFGSPRARPSFRYISYQLARARSRAGAGAGTFQPQRVHVIGELFVAKRQKLRGKPNGKPKQRQQQQLLSDCWRKYTEAG